MQRWKVPNSDCVNVNAYRSPVRSSPWAKIVGSMTDASETVYVYEALW